MLRRPLTRLALAVGLALGAGFAHANLTSAGVWTGNVGLSVDGVGTNAIAGAAVQASIPVGATVLQAYLYAAGIPIGQPLYGGPSSLAAYNASGITLNGVGISTFDTLVGATSSRADIVGWATARADVTALVASFVAASPATSSFSWQVTEGLLNDVIDGTVLAIVYRQAGLAQASVALLDGGQRTGGETTFVNLAAPLGNVSAPDFRAQLGLGISYSVDVNLQQSTVDVNGSRLTNFAGNKDDGLERADGSLITVGGLGDNPANNVSSYADDDELYDLRPFLSTGASQFTITTTNPSDDDNIFFASLYVTGQIGSVTPEPPVPAIPEPETYALMLAGLGLLGAAAKRRRTRAGRSA